MYSFSKELSKADNIIYANALQYEKINKDNLSDCTYPVNYKTVIDNVELVLPIGESADKYPAKLGKYKVIWNWTDIGHDFCYYLWKVLGEPIKDNDDIEVVYSFDAYDQFRNEYVEPQLVCIFEKLEKLGYISSFTIYSEDKDMQWKQFGKSDGSIDCAIVDTSFLKNNLIMEQIKVLLWTTSFKLEHSPFFLTDASDRQYLSETPGKLGGHYKLKIYGQLDCPSANRYVAEGKYVKHRVFFADEETAIKAGYRPCARCMPEEYKKWKSQNSNIVKK